MLPLGDLVPCRTRPVVTAATAAAVVAATTITHFVLSAETRSELLWTWGATSRSVPWPAVATAWLIDPAWLAGLANAAALLLFGPAVEDRLGRLRFALTLGVAAVAAAAVPITVRLAPMLPAAGAAGPVAAVLAGHLTLFPPSRLAWWMPAPGGGRLLETQALWAVAVWAVLVPGNLARQVQAGVVTPPPLAGTATGVAVGVVSAKLLARADRLRVEWWSDAD